MLKIKSVIKNFLMVGVSMLLCFSTLTTGISAKGSEENSELSTEELMILEEIYELDPDFTYEGELVSVSKETQVMETAEERLTSGNILERGAIGDNFMTIYVTASRVTDSGRDTFALTATATWKMVPTVRMQDGFAIAWGKEFALKSSYATASYKSMGVVSGKTSKISAAPNAGIAYSVEASHYYGQALDWVRINATITHSNSTGFANVSAAYCHRTVSFGGLGVSFGGNSAGITFSAKGIYDTMANYTLFSY